jgi:hypothetical protein
MNNEFNQVSIKNSGSEPIYKNLPHLPGTAFIKCGKCGKLYPLSDYDEKQKTYVMHQHQCEE